MNQFQAKTQLIMQIQLSTNIIKINWVAKPTLLTKIWVYLLIELYMYKYVISTFP
jgi:hypothetical protein